MLLKSLLDKNKKIAVLAGAGISLDSPSNLLDGWNFMFEALRRVCPQEIDDMLRCSSAELKKGDTWRKSWILSILDPPETNFFRPGERLRFEVMMAELVQSGLDAELNVMKCLDSCDRPNRNHYILAHLIRTGHVVITTNFDRLIEIAYKRLVGEDGPSLRVACMDEDFPNPDLSPNGQPTLWKIHGSFSVNGQDMRRSIQATMMSILSRAMTARKGAFLKQVLADFDLLVVGYSGWDDLDIIPTLSNAPSNRRLIWIEHRDVAEPEVKNATKLNEQAKTKWEIDSIARDRILFTTDSNGKTIRDPDNVLIVSTPTRGMMDAICEVYFEGCLFDTEEEDFKFGWKFPGEVQKYFDDWRANLSHGRSSPYRFTANIFSNRANARDDVRERLQIVYRKIEELQAAPTANYEEQLQYLIHRFNNEKSGNHVIIEQLREKLLALFPLLPPELLGMATRLLACMVWVLEGQTAGTEMFRKAVAIDRKAGRDKEEFSTLTTWRSFTGYSQWSDLFAGDKSEAIRERVSEEYLQKLRDENEYILRLSGYLPFPAEETERIHKLAAKIGFFPILWNQSVQSTYHVIDDDPQVMLIMHDRISRIKRFCVDLGDVLGEAQTTLISGRMYLIDEQYMIAIEEFLRVCELNRIVNEPELMFEAMRYLKYCADQIGLEYMNTIRPHLQQSMYGKVVS